MKKQIKLVSTNVSIALAMLCSSAPVHAQSNKESGTTEEEIKARFDNIEKDTYKKEIQPSMKNVVTTKALVRSLSLDEPSYSYTAYVHNNERLNLHLNPNVDSVTNSTVSPQNLQVYQIHGEWIQVNTWMGPRWIRNVNGAVEEIKAMPYRKQIKLAERVFLYELPFEETKRTESIAPQTVQVVGKSKNGWFKVKTWLGEKWTYTTSGEIQEPPVRNDIILPKPMALKAVVNATDLNVRSAPSTNGVVLGKLTQYSNIDVKEVQSGWATIQYNNQTAYVSAAYLNLYQEPQPETNVYKEGTMLLNSQSRLNLYRTPSSDTYVGATVAPQVLTASRRVDKYWYEIQTWLGPMFVNLEESSGAEATDVITYSKGTLNLNKTTEIYDYPFASSPVIQAVAAQPVPYVAKTKGYYLIETWLGQKWIKSEESSYPIIDGGSSEVPMSSYKVTTTKGSNYYKDLNTAKINFANSTDNDAYLTVNDAVIDMKSGFARANKVADIYNLSGSKVTYVEADTEMTVTKITDDKVYISYAGKDGFIAKADVNLIPFAKGENRSSFKKDSRGKLIHRIYKGNSSYYDLEVGTAPDYLVTGQQYYTYNPKQIDGKDSYQYFMYMPIRMKASYTAEEIDNYIRTNSPDSPLIGTGKYFVGAANKYNINVGYFLAHAIHESAWGKSKIAKEKNNLFGFKAVDSNPYDGAAAFATLEEGIYYCADYVSKNYINTSDWRYNGGFVGDKAEGMNVYYASDAYWGEKIAGYMNKLDAMYGNRERKKYPLGKVSAGVTAYTMSNNNPINAKKLAIGTYALKLSEVQTSQGTFYQITSDDAVYNNQLYIKSSDFKTVSSY
ncbi:glucosaminidase domain-containing protein [Bacillus cereus]|uniref:glucosaminidase domain-containing protein n=1 Tax=Bacillus cereus TaxID=1396 RepID=UPI0030796424